MASTISDPVFPYLQLSIGIPSMSLSSSASSAMMSDISPTVCSWLFSGPVMHAAIFFCSVSALAVSGVSINARTSASTSMSINFLSRHLVLLGSLALDLSVLLGFLWVRNS